MTLKSQGFLIFLMILSSVSLSRPPTHCLWSWEPDQFVPANLTLLPVESTI